METKCIFRTTAIFTAVLLLNISYIFSRDQVYQVNGAKLTCVIDISEYKKVIIGYPYILALDSYKCLYQRFNDNWIRMDNNVTVLTDKYLIKNKQVFTICNGTILKLLPFHTDKIVYITGDNLLTIENNTFCSIDLKRIYGIIKWEHYYQTELKIYSIALEEHTSVVDHDYILTK